MMMPNNTNETEEQAWDQSDLTTTDILLSVVNIFLSITAFLGNALILTALHKVSSIYPPTKLLFQCLAVTDLCVGFTIQPIFAMTIFFSFPSITGDVVSFLNPLLIEVTILTSTAISVDRLLALLLGLRYRHVVTLRRVRVAILCIWLVSALPGSFTFFTLFDVSIKLVLILIIFSLVISVGSNTKIFFILRHQQAQLQDSVQQDQPNIEGIPLNIARYKKIVLTIIWVQLATVACYLPFIITVITTMFFNVSSNKAFRMTSPWLITLLYLNSSLNPILYCWKIKDVRQQVKSTIHQFHCSSC